VITTHILPSS